MRERVVRLKALLYFLCFFFLNLIFGCVLLRFLAVCRPDRLTAQKVCLNNHEEPIFHQILLSYRA